MQLDSAGDRDEEDTVAAGLRLIVGRGELVDQLEAVGARRSRIADLVLPEAGERDGDDAGGERAGHVVTRRPAVRKQRGRAVERRRPLARAAKRELVAVDRVRVERDGRGAVEVDVDVRVLGGGQVRIALDDALDPAVGPLRRVEGGRDLSARRGRRSADVEAVRPRRRRHRRHAVHVRAGDRDRVGADARAVERRRRAEVDVDVEVARRSADGQPLAREQRNRLP